MAKQDMKYAVNATDGSSAYVLAPEIPAYDEPARRARPEKRTRKTVRSASQPQSKYGVSPIAILGFAAVAAMLVFVLLGYVKLNDVANGTSQLEDKLEELTENERRLHIEYEKVFDINEIERYATTELGMTKPSDAQIYTVNVTPPDKAEVLAADSSSGHPVKDFIAFLKSLTEYFL